MRIPRNERSAIVLSFLASMPARVTFLRFHINDDAAGPGAYVPESGALTR